MRGTGLLFAAGAILAGCTPGGMVLDSHMLPDNQFSITGQSYSASPEKVQGEISSAARSVCNDGVVVRWELNPPHVNRMAVGSAYSAIIQCPTKD